MGFCSLPASAGEGGRSFLAACQSFHSRPAVLPDGHPAPHLLHLGAVDLGHRDPRGEGVLQPGHHRPPWVHHEAVAVALPPFVVPAGLGGRDNVALRLDGPRPQQNLPVGLAWCPMESVAVHRLGHHAARVGEGEGEAEGEGRTREEGGGGGPRGAAALYFHYPREAGGRRAGLHLWAL